MFRRVEDREDVSGNGSTWEDLTRKILGTNKGYPIGQLWGLFLSSSMRFTGWSIQFLPASSVLLCIKDYEEAAYFVAELLDLTHFEC
eukprot:c5731_g1_i1 orf=167-427(-)